jgi:hypothetical protein
VSTQDALVLALLGLFTLCVPLAALGAVVAGWWLVELVLSWLWS